MVFLRMLMPAVFFLAAFVLLASSLRVLAGSRAPEQACKFVKAFAAKIRTLEVKASLAWWIANTTGKDEDFAKKVQAQNRIDEVLADKEAFQEVKALKDKGNIDDPIFARAIDVIYLAYLEKQVDPALLKKMVAKA